MWNVECGVAVQRKHLIVRRTSRWAKAFSRGEGGSVTLHPIRLLKRSIFGKTPATAYRYLSIISPTAVWRKRASEPVLLQTVRDRKRFACPLPSRHRISCNLFDVYSITKHHYTDNKQRRCRATFSSGEGFGAKGKRHHKGDHRHPLFNPCTQHYQSGAKRPTIPNSKFQIQNFHFPLSIFN